ncbi:MAG: hypothetical protein K2X93_18170 [Candidatus Obscuribacterales bacterium]|nr:hypothetical protein [Candidatus Obscuribacterales bacterium]
MAWLVVAGLVISAQPAHAYIDPGTGSFLFQLLIGTGLAMLATVRVWWGKVVSLVKPKPKS